ncbi:hypothetical protein BDW62DRAFT_216262 [Aspergillus aurantiobrunneus]
MGRLTYSARKISGIKAGQVVSKDLKKRIPPGLGAKAAARDPTLEIDITGKCLTDEGFAEFIDELLECIRFRDEEHPSGLAKVTEIHLQGNNLTVKSLSKLGEVIANSTGDLRELDLSQNNIRIVTAEDKAIWKAFLCSFKNCYMLKKLDFSGNPIGTAGFDVLALVYLKSDLDYLEADADAIVRENHGEELALAEEAAALKVGDGKENHDPRAGRAKKSPHKGGKAAKQNGTSSTATAPSRSFTFNDLKKYACTRGLRSVPYLTLSNLDLKNGSAVHLSRMLATQRPSEQLLTYLPPGKASAIPESAQDGKSIIWQPNEGLAVFANRLLDVTESIREFQSKAQEDSDGEHSTDEDAKRKLQSKMALEFTRLTKRVRIESLKQEGVHASDIAIIALKMMVVSRALLLEDKDRPREEAAPVEPPTAEEQEKQGEQDEEEREKEQEEEEEEWPIAEQSPSPVEYHAEPQYTFAPSFPAGPFQPGAVLFDEEFPALQPARQEQIPPRVATPEPEPEPETKEPVNSNPSIIPSSSPNHRSPGTTRPSGGKGIMRGQKARKSSWRFGLPFESWRRIIADALGADGILDQEQQARIMYYASDWDAVAYELTIKGAEDHQQIWKFLETVRCCTYTPLP